VKRAAAAAALSVFAMLALPIPSRADSLQQLREFLVHTNSVKGAFEQVGARSGAVASRGTFEFSRPGRFRWIYIEPYQQTIVSDGAKLYVYDPDLNQVTVKSLKGSLPASPASLLFGSDDFERQFQVKADASRDGVDWMQATPRAQDSSFERIRIGFRGGLPVAMELVDSFGQTTRLSFSALERNPPIASARFRFDAPQGADVLEDR